MICGIALAEFGPGWLAATQPPRGDAAAVTLASLLTLAILMFHVVRSATRRADALTGLTLVMLLSLTGLVRHSFATHLPANHLVHALAEEPLLARIVGDVVTTPIRHPPERRNPFLSFPPDGSDTFIVAAHESRTLQATTPVSGLLYVRVDQPSHADPATRAAQVQPGDRVVLTGRLYRPRGPRNEGDVDWRAQRRLDGILVCIAIDNPRLLVVEQSSRSRWPATRARIRAWVRAALLDDSAAAGEGGSPGRRLLDAMVLGQRSATGRHIDEPFVRTGTIHILSVSGFHVAVLAAGCWALMRWFLRRGTRTTAVFLLGVLGAYALIVEPNAPVARSLLMAGCGCAAVLIGRPLASVNWLAAAAMMVLLWNPLELFRAGFQLSFVQVLALLWFVPPLYRRFMGIDPEGLEPRRDADSWPALALRLLRGYATGLGIASLVAWSISAPLSALHFGQFTPWGALQSFLLAPPFAIVITLGFLSVVLGWLPLLGPALLALSTGLLNTLHSFVVSLAALPISWIETPAPQAIVILATYGLLALWWTMRPRSVATDDSPSVALQPPPSMLVSPRALARFTLSAQFTALWTWWLAGIGPPPAADWRVQILDVGNGSAALLTTNRGCAALFDIGTTDNFDVGDTARRVMRRSGVRRLEAVFVSHENFDHYSGLPTVLRGVPTQHRYVNPYYHALRADDPGLRRLERLLPDTATLPEPLARGGGGTIGHVEYDVLWPPADLGAWSANERSLVIRLSVGDCRLLVTGDIERKAMRQLLAAHASGETDLRADVLIAPHHGSIAAALQVTAEFYAAVAPRFVLVSTAKSRPGLPDLVRRTAGPDCRLLSTRDVGAITITITADGRLEVTTPFAPVREPDEHSDTPGHRR